MSWKFQYHAHFSHRGLMAEHIKETSKCSICLTYLENPMYLKCGYICCFKCLNSLKKEPDGEGLLCPNCSVVSQKKDLIGARKLGELVSKVKDLEPHLTEVLRMNPRIRKLQGKTLVQPAHSP